MGYASEDIISNIFRVCKNHQMAEHLKLEFIKVSHFFILIWQITFYFYIESLFPNMIFLLYIYFLSYFYHENDVYQVNFLISIFFQEIGYAHLRIVKGVSSLLQLSGLLARLCSKAVEQEEK